MLTVLGSAKGSPGTTSLSLVLAAVWPRLAALVEADTAGGDLAMRCRTRQGTPPTPTPGLVTLGASTRAGGGGGASMKVRQASQELGCGVTLVQGVPGPAQTLAMTELWGGITEACVGADVDVIADLGRLEPRAATRPLVSAAQAIIVVAAARADSVRHTRTLISDMQPALLPGQVLVPAMVGPWRGIKADCAALDELLGESGIARVSPTQPVPLDPAALRRLEGGKTAGELSRTRLIKAGRELAGGLVSPSVDTPAPEEEVAAS